MVNAIVLMTVEPKRINDVAEQLASEKYVSEVYSVGGRFDIVSIIRAPTNEDLSDVVTKRFLHIEGILSSETLIAFRAFSHHDLAAMFDLD